MAAFPARDILPGAGVHTDPGLHNNSEASGSDFDGDYVTVNNDKKHVHVLFRHLAAISFYVFLDSS